MRRGTARRLTLCSLVTILLAAAASAPAGAGDIARPFLALTAPPVALAKGVPTGTRAPVPTPGGIQLSLTQAFPIQGGTLVQETFQNGLPQAPGLAVTTWVEVTPVLATPYRVARLPSGKGVLQRSRDRGRTWRNRGPAQVRTSGSNVIFTLLDGDGATADATIRAGWTAAKPDGSGVTASAFPAVLGTLAGTGPWRLPAIGLSPTGVCAAPAVSFSAGLGGVAISSPGPRWPAGTSVGISAIPDLAGAVAPARLDGQPATGVFDVFPPGLGAGRTGSVTVPPAGAGPLVVAPTTLFGAPLGLRGDGAVAFTLRIQLGSGVCERWSPVLPLAPPPAAAAPPESPPARPSALPPGCDKAELQRRVELMRQRIQSYADDLETLIAQLKALEQAALAAAGKSSAVAALRAAGVLKPEAELAREIQALEVDIGDVTELHETYVEALKLAEKKLADCR